PAVQVSTTFEIARSPQYGGISSNDWDPTTDPVRLRVQGTPTQITFLFDHTGTWEVAATISSSDPSPASDIFTLLSSLEGGQVGLQTDTGGGFNTAPFSFHYFKTNLVVAP